MEARIARLESDVARLRTDVADIKIDLRTLREKIEARLDRLETKFDTLRDGVAATNLSIAKAQIWAVILYSALAAALLGAMARGFKWI